MEMIKVEHDLRVERVSAKAKAAERVKAKRHGTKETQRPLAGEGHGTTPKHEEGCARGEEVA